MIVSQNWIIRTIISFGLWNGACAQGSGQTTAYDPAHLFSVSELRADLGWYQQQLQQKHPGLYTYTSRTALDACFDSIALRIDHPMTEREFFNLLSTVSSRICDGHTHIFPSDEAMAYQEEQGRFLPLKIVWLDGKMYTTGSWRHRDTIPAGSEILAIDGREAAEIRTFMMERQLRDGYNISYANWILNRWFRSYYAFHFGWSDYYNIRYRQAGQAPCSARLSAMSNDDIARCKPVESFKGQGITLFTDTAQSLALLTIRDFHADVLKDQYGQRFKPSIDQHFRTIRRLRIQNLVIDLRDNQGGDVKFGTYLLSFLINRPFKTLDSFGKVRHGKAPEKDRVRNANGPSQGWHRPKRHTYKGKLYILVNGGSFSNSVIVCSALRRNTDCIFIGEESGGNPALINGSGNYSTLPHTKLKIMVPRLQYRLSESGSNTGRGIQPDFVVKPGLDDLLKNEDIVRSFALNLIHQNHRED